MIHKLVPRCVNNLICFKTLQNLANQPTLQTAPSHLSLYLFSLSLSLSLSIYLFRTHPLSHAYTHTLIQPYTRLHLKTYSHTQSNLSALYPILFTSTNALTSLVFSYYPFTLHKGDGGLLNSSGVAYVSRRVDQVHLSL